MTGRNPRNESLFMRVCIPTVWILTLVFVSEVSAAPSFVREQNVIKAANDGQPMFEYQFAPDAAYKPYIFQLYSPGGVPVLRDGAPAHPHHHGLMFGVGVDGVTFWGETIPKNDIGGHQIPRQTEVRDGLISQQLEWRTPSGELALCETRTIQPLSNRDATMLTWRCRLEAPVGKEAVTLSGHPYYGLGARFPESMDKVATLSNSSGQPGESVGGDHFLVPASWVACTGAAADGRVITVAIFDHPQNLRYPSQKFTMATPFAYISSTLNWKEPFPLKAGEPLELCYGVAVWDGKMEPSQIDQACRQWQELAKPKL